MGPWLGAALACFAAAVLLVKPLRQFLHFVWLAIAIPAEKALAKVLPLRVSWLGFPRNEAELFAEPRRFFQLLQASGCVPAEGNFTAVRGLGKLEAEPDKNSTSCAVALEWTVEKGKGGKTSVAQSKNVFAKFQCGRGLPLWLQAIRGVLEPGVAREVEFYRQLAKSMPVRVATPYLARSAPSFNRVCIVAEYLDGDVTADWTGASEAQFRAILRGAARFHAQYWHGATPGWIRAKAGLQYCGFVTGFIKDEPPWYQELWSSLRAHFEGHPVTLLHGDCRPGNMMWLRQAKGGPEEEEALTEEAEAERAIVFNDWEAVTVGPSLWDFVYCTTLGQEAAPRKERADGLLRTYVGALREGGAELPLQDARRDVALLTLVLYYVSAVVAKKKFWSNQGNTSADAQAWQRRVAQAVRELRFEGAVAEALQATGHGVRASHLTSLQALCTGPKL